MHDAASLPKPGLPLREKRRAPQSAQPRIGQAHSGGARSKPAREPAEAAGARGHSFQHRHGRRAVMAPAVEHENHSLFEIAAFTPKAGHQAGRLAAVNELQGPARARLEPGFLDIEAAERTLSVIKQEGLVLDGVQSGRGRNPTVSDLPVRTVA